jgi:hypothetical protein
LRHDEASIADLGRRLGTVGHVVPTASAQARGRIADLDRDAIGRSTCAVEEALAPLDGQDLRARRPCRIRQRVRHRARSRATRVLQPAFGTGYGQRTAVVFYGIVFGLAAMLFNVIWGYAHHHRLLATTIDAEGARAISRRFRLALAWIATGSLLGALVPALGLAVIAAFIPYYWLPIRGEIARAEPRHGGGQP